MQTAFVIFNILAASALAFSATADFVRYEKVLSSMAKARVPESWLTTLAVVKAAGALGPPSMPDPAPHSSSLPPVAVWPSGSVGFHLEATLRLAPVATLRLR